MRTGIFVLTFALAALPGFSQSLNVPWNGYGHDPQHRRFQPPQLNR